MANGRDALRVRAILVTIAIVAGALTAVEAWLAGKEAAYVAVGWLAGVTGAFTVAMLVAAHINSRGKTPQAVLTACIAILAIQLTYTILYPAAYPAIAIASVTIVALALPHVRGRSLYAVTALAWLVACAAVLWGTLGEPLVAMPETAHTPIVVGSGLAAVTVALVLMWQFATTMRHTVTETLAAHNDLRSAHDRLRAMEGTKTQFINSAAHELNTPLTPVLLQVELLKQGGATGKTNPHSLAVLERNIRRIQDLVHEMLDVARLQTGRALAAPGPLRVGASVAEAVDDFLDTATAKRVELQQVLAQDPIVLADPVRLNQVLSNLISNAVKYTPEGGKVLITTRAENGHAEVVVADTGVGLTAEQMAALFQPFVRLHDHPGGVGLGLYITKGVVEAMGGTITAESDGPGKGATFRVRLPLAGTRADATHTLRATR